MRLTRLVIRVLAEYHHLNLVERTEVEGVKYKLPGRIAFMVTILLLDKTDKGGEVGLFKFFRQTLLPRLLDRHLHRR